MSSRSPVATMEGASSMAVATTKASTAWALESLARASSPPARRAMLVVMGVLLLTGVWGTAVAWLRGPIAGYNLPL